MESILRRRRNRDPELGGIRRGGQAPGRFDQLVGGGGGVRDPVCRCGRRGQEPVLGQARPKLDYGMLFIVGTFLGAFVSSLVGRSFSPEVVPAVWAERFGPSR